jgi:hypothetical protein
MDLSRHDRNSAKSRDNILRTESAIMEFVRSGKPLGAIELIELLETNMSPEMRSLGKAYEEGNLELEFLTDAEFDGILARWGKAHARHALFEQPNRILLREYQRQGFASASEEVAFLEVLERLKGAVHEWEHWRHTSGNFEGIEKGGKSIDLGLITPHERLVSEMLAFLEQYRWSYKNFDDDFGAISRHLGQTPSQFFRNLADQAYFGSQKRK